MSIPKPRYYWKFNDGEGTLVQGAPVDPEARLNYKLGNNAAQQGVWGAKAWTPEGLLMHPDKSEGAHKVTLDGASPTLTGAWTVAVWVNVHTAQKSSNLTCDSDFALRIHQYQESYKGIPLSEWPIGITGFGKVDAEFLQPGDAGDDQEDRWIRMPMQQWVHLAMVSENETEKTLYLNGEYAGTLEDTRLGDVTIPLLNLGWRGGRHSHMSIREMMIFDKALKGSEIRKVKDFPSNELEYLVVAKKEDRILRNDEGDAILSWGECKDGDKREYVIRNIGKRDMRVDRVSLVGESEFELGKIPPTDKMLAPGQKWTFEVIFKPDPEKGTGERTAQVRIECDNPTTPTFNFRVKATATAKPLMVVADGDTELENDKDLHWGGQPKAGAEKILTIRNDGKKALNISEISIDGDFKLKPLAGAEPQEAVSALKNLDALKAGKSVQIAVVFTPQGSDGKREGKLVFTSDSARHKKFTVTVETTYRAKAPVMIVKEGKADDPTKEPIVNDTSVGWDEPVADGEKTFVLLNQGDAMLCVTSLSISGSEFTISPAPSKESPLKVGVKQSRTFTVKFQPSSGDGDREATVTIESNVSSPSTFKFDLAFKFDAQPIMRVMDGSVTMTGEKPAKWGTMAAKEEKVITLKNVGRDVLNVSSISITEPFKLKSKQENIQVAKEKEKDYPFTVVFDPAADGTKNSTLTIVSDDPRYEKTAFEVSIEARYEAPKPVMKLTGPDGKVVAKNPPLDWGTLADGDQKAFTIENRGTGNLNITSVKSASKYFTLALADGPIDSQGRPLGPKQKETFTLTFNPPTQRDGNYSGTITIVSNDSTSTRFSFNVKAAYDAKPQIAVSESSQPVEDNDTKPVSFGSLETAQDRYIKVTNKGHDLLKVSELELSNKDSFELISAPSTFDLRKSRSRCIQVRFKPNGTEGTKSATLTIHSNDPSYARFRVKLQAEYSFKKPRLEVREEGNIVADKGERNWGTIVHGVQRSLKVKNLGRQILKISKVSSNDSSFTVEKSNNSYASLSRNQSHTYTLTFTPPNKDGVQDAKIKIKSNDPRYSRNFTYEVEANHRAEPLIEVWDGTKVTAGKTLTWGTLDSDDTKSITVKNTGHDILKVSSITANKFKFEPRSKDIKPGEEYDFEVSLRSNLPDGYQDEQITIHSNDPNTKSFRFNIQATLDNKPALVVKKYARYGNDAVLKHDRDTELNMQASGQEFKLVIHNEGKDKLNLTKVECVGEHWSMSPVPIENYAIGVGGQLSVTLTFEPKDNGRHTAELKITSDDPTHPNYTHSVKAQALGLQPQLEVSDDDEIIESNGIYLWEGGGIGPGNKLWYTVKNKGNATLNINDIDLDGVPVESKSDFIHNALLPMNIAPGESEQFALIMGDDVSEDLATARVKIESNAPNRLAFTAGAYKQGAGTLYHFRRNSPIDTSTNRDPRLSRSTSRPTRTESLNGSFVERKLFPGCEWLFVYGPFAQDSIVYIEFSSCKVRSPGRVSEMLHIFRRNHTVNGMSYYNLDRVSFPGRPGIGFIIPRWSCLFLQWTITKLPGGRPINGIYRSVKMSGPTWEQEIKVVSEGYSAPTPEDKLIYTSSQGNPPVPRVPCPNNYAYNKKLHC